LPWEMTFGQDGTGEAAMKGTLMNTKHLRQNTMIVVQAALKPSAMESLLLHYIAGIDIHVPNVNTDLLQALLKQWQPI